MRTGSLILFGVIHHFGLPDHVHLDLTGVLQFFLDLLGDIPGQQHHLVLADLVGSHHDADLSARLDGEGLLHTGEGGGDFLQLLQTLDIVLQVLAPGAGAGGGDSVGGLDNACLLYTSFSQD